MSHLPLGGTKSFLTILALMALSSFKFPSFPRLRRAAAVPGPFPAVQPAVLDAAA
jgi:hypothetical protein